MHLLLLFHASDVLESCQQTLTYLTLHGRQTFLSLFFPPYASENWQMAPDREINRYDISNGWNDSIQIYLGEPMSSLGSFIGLLQRDYLQEHE